MGLWLFILLTFSQLDTSICQTLRPGSDPMIIVGLYHQCLGDRNVTQSNICQAAVDFEFQYKRKNWKDFLQTRGYGKVGNLLTPDDIRYDTINFCTENEALRIAMNLKLNSTFFISNKTQHPPQWNKRSIHSWEFTSRIILVIVHAPEEISTFLQEIFLDDTFVVWFVGQDIEVPTAFQDYNIHSKTSTFSENADNLVYMINKHTRDTKKGFLNKEASPKLISFNEARDFAIIRIEDNSTFYRLEYEHFIEALYPHILRLKLCPRFYSLNVSDLQSLKTVLEHILKLDETHLSVLIGEPKITLEFIKHYAKRFSTLLNLGKLKFLHGLIVLDFKDHFGQNDGFYFKFPLLNLFTFSKEVFLHHFDTIIHQIRQNYPGLNLTPNREMTAYNCANVLHNFLLKMVQIIQFYKYPLNYFQYR